MREAKWQQQAHTCGLVGLGGHHGGRGGVVRDHGHELVVHNLAEIPLVLKQQLGRERRLAKDGRLQTETGETGGA